MFSSSFIYFLILPACVQGLDLARFSTVVTADTSPVDVTSFINEFVETWKQENPQIGVDELQQVLDTAQSAKGLFTPGSRLKRDVEHIKPTHLPRHVPLHHRQLANSTLNTNSTLAAARAIVRQAQKEANERNRERFRNPRLNTYYAKFSDKAALKARTDDADALAVNETVAVAAALVAEADAAREQSIENPTLPPELLQLKNQLQYTDSDGEKLVTRADGSFWMEDIAHIGIVPYGGADNDGYVVFRNVKDYGAVGDGKTDDTEAINKAMADQGRCGRNCGASTVKPAILYFPSGTYLISSPITSYYNTQMIGHAINLPIIKAATSFVGLGVISSDEYTGGDGGAEQWFINQNNFLRQLRNFIIDVRSADMTDIAGVHWQVAQATSITNVQFWQSDHKDKNHMGIFAENGSGGFMSDLTFLNGAIGMQCGNQQFTTRNLVFSGCRTAIDMLWDWGWTWKSLIISTTEYGIKMTGDFRGGSLVVLDSYMLNTPTGIYVTSPKGAAESEAFSITIDNLRINNVGTTVKHQTQGVTLSGGSTTIESWVIGKVYDENNPNGRYQGGPLASVHPRTKSLMSGSNYFEQKKPQYTTTDANTFISARMTAKGNGVSDDSFGLALIFALGAAVHRPVYVPFGSYIVTKTVKIPVGAQIVGECWAQIVAKGAYFADMYNPQVMIQVGQEGDAGLVEIQDLVFTVEGPTAGVILLEWNVAETSQGSAAMWDSHFRIGGAKGSRLAVENCPKLTGSVNQNCIAGSMLLHMTRSSSGYLENVWAWVADHDFDSGPAQTQIDVYVARGILIESQGPVWMYGTASEHCMLYQYLLYGAKNVFMGMIQTESPYFLPSPQSPGPFTNVVGDFPGDPDFKDCDGSNPHCAAAWGLMIVGSTNVHIFGAGLYNWFQEYTQPCVDSQDCQQRVVFVKASGNIWMYNLYTIGTVEMINLERASPILAKANTNTNEHPFTSIVNAWLVASSGEGELNDDVEEFPQYIEDLHRAPCNGMYDSLDQIVADASFIPSHCFDTYIVNVELGILKKALDDYSTIVNEGYDSKFKVYERVTREQAPLQVDAYMRGAQASGNFRCIESKYVYCCKDCSSAWACINGCDSSKNCQKGQRDFTVDCPTSWAADTDIYADIPRQLTYALTNEAKFFSEISEKYGIQKDWIEFGDRRARIANGCQYAGADVNECDKKKSIWWHGWPLLKDINIPNPKDVVSNSYDKSLRLATVASDAQRFAPYDRGVSGRGDLVDALALPSLMMSEAVESMRSVVEVAKQALEEERKSVIANFLTAILMLIPVAGEAAAAVGATTMRAIIGIAGELANVGVTIYELVDDPKSSLMTVFGFVMGGGVSRQPFREAAAARRGMNSAETGKLAPRIKNDIGTMTNVRSQCLKR